MEQKLNLTQSAYKIFTRQRRDCDLNQGLLRPSPAR